MRTFLLHVAVPRHVDPGHVADVVSEGLDVERSFKDGSGRVAVLPAGVWLISRKDDVDARDVLQEVQIIASRIGHPHGIAIGRVGQLAVSSGFGRSSAPPPSPESVQLARVALVQRGIV